ncbi:FecR family protein [Chitinophaga cymbidii]|uniref:Iron dicitrate transporter FecR n=1 Tax=Chitinophaga cymbidii TaxID=1096750 RepID=A0A512RQ16_9BACT|nr:FecR domain-containing protein [Chitinophaga cymbidii]GEP97785.1 iron dicitrate transporter FecR [Chitinophaga cymbidii]
MDKNHVLDLLIKEHYGLITIAEQEELDQILADSQEARDMQLEVRSRPANEARQFIEQADPSAAYDLTIARYEAHRARKRTVRMRWFAAAAVTGIVAAIAFFMRPQQSVQEAQLTGNNASSANGLTLQLADGRTIELQDSGQQAITSGNTKLSNNNRVLRFNSGNVNANSWSTLSVPAKLDYRVELADGTIVWLNSTTRLRFPFNFAETREVYVEGEAYFKIAPDAAKPFIVHSGNSSIQVLGTEFNLNSYNAGTLITSLVQGKVAVTVRNERVELKAGEELVATATDVKRQRFDARITLGWREGIHYFQDADMTEIAEMIGRYFDVKMVMDSPSAANLRFRGRLHRHQPLQNFIDQLNTLGNVNLYWKGDVLHCKTI